jgi:opacity protein-like surface antigen
MSAKRIAISLAMVIGTVSSPAFAQSETPEKNEVSVQAFGSFVKDTTKDGIRNTATNSGGVLESYRHFFDVHNGIEGNYGYSLNSQNYVSGSGVLGGRSYSHELSAAYVFRVPMRNITPFVLAGVGSLIFDPTGLAGASSQGRASFVYGAGADIRFSQHIFMRVEYRGFVYNSPTFGLTALAGDDRTTHRAEPSLGFGYRW